LSQKYNLTVRKDYFYRSRSQSGNADRLFCFRLQQQNCPGGFPVLNGRSEDSGLCHNQYQFFNLNR